MNEDLKHLDDADILALSVRRPEAFSELVERYERLFMRKATAILREEEDARDAVQEALVRIYVAARKFKKQEGASFSSWAYRILVNQCYTAYRAKHRSAAVSFDLDPELAEIIPDQADLEELEHKLTADYVVRLLSKLPLLLRRSVELHFIQGVPQKEIAEREGVSHGVIRQRIHRAKKELRELDLQFVSVPSSASGKTSS